MRTSCRSLVCSILGIGILVATAGCRESVGVVTAHGEGKGTAEVYDATFDDIWIAAHIALHWDAAGTPEDHPAQGYVVTNHPESSGPSSLDQVGVWFEPMSPTKTRVKVIVMTGTQYTAGIVGPDEQTVQRDIAKALALLQNGQPIPRQRP